MCYLRTKLVGARHAMGASSLSGRVELAVAVAVIIWSVVIDRDRAKHYG